MLSDKTEDDMIELVGHDKGTKTKEIVRALDNLGINNSGRLIRVKKKRPLPTIAILKVVYRKIKNCSGFDWHWILKYGDRFYDPDSQGQLSTTRHVSYIEIKQ